MPKELGVVEVNRREHDDAFNVPLKRVMPWGFDGVEKQPLSVDTGGRTNIGSGSATIFAVVNTGAAGVQNSMVTLNAGPNQIGSVTVSNPISVSSMATIYAVVNTSAVGNTNALATLLAGPNQIGSVTISHIVNSITTITPRTDYIGLVSVSGNVVNSAGSNFIGLATVVNGAGVAQIGSVTVSNVVGAIATIAPRTDFIGLVSVSGNVVNSAGTAQMGSVTVSNVVNSLATVVNYSSGKTFMTANIALNATNLSGATIFISAASKKFYVMNLFLSNSSAVGISVLNGATYLSGNASIRAQLAANSGIIDNNNVGAPVYFGLANQTNFLIATDTAAPISGRINWYEE